MSLYRLIKRAIGKAIFGYNLLEEGDRILVALSGGEDSLLLLHFLSEWQYLYHQRIEILAVHLDMGFPKNEEIYGKGVSFLENFCKERKIKFHWAKLLIGEIVLEAFDKGTASPCFLCSWNRRKYLFNLAKELNFRKIALGHHKDDVITTFFMNLLYCGELSTILPKQEMFQGTLYIIRPLYFLEKELISRFIAKNKWSVLENPCPFSGETKRTYLKRLLEESFFSKDPVLKKNVFSAIFNPRLDYLPKPLKGRINF